MAIKHVPACSCDCLVSEATRQECALTDWDTGWEMPHAFADPLDFLPLNDFFSGRAWLGSNIHVGSKLPSQLIWIYSALQRAAAVSSRLMEAWLVVWPTNFFCIWFDFNARCTFWVIGADMNPSEPLPFSAGNKLGHDRSHLPLTLTYVCHNYAVHIHVNKLSQTQSCRSCRNRSHHCDTFKFISCNPSNV